MNIPFRRVTADPQPFVLEKNGVRFEGTLRKYRSGLVLLEATMQGGLDVDCYLCGDSFAIMPDEKVEFLISDGVFHGQDETYDVVEMHDGNIDLDEVFDSEVALIESDYHACPNCR
ncbi:hypothetical protein ACXWTF_03410 [Thiomicrolovo sp. ZZH C-3]